MNKNLSLVNKITLLALIPLLTTTGNGVWYALISGLTLTAIAFVINFIYSQNKDFFKQKTGEIILWGLGSGMSYFLYQLLPLIFQRQAAYFNYYFILIGVTPLLYAEMEMQKLTNFVVNHVLFLDLMLAVSLLRELLGQGSILNYQLFTNPPLIIANSPAGAFMILGITAFIYEIIIKKFDLEAKFQSKTEVNLESEVE